MRRLLLISTVFALSFVSAGQTTAPPSSTAGSSTVANAIRILEPKAGAKLGVDFVQLRYDLENASSASGSPIFRLQLDARDPVNTTDTSYTFTGLAPGTHSVSITVVDANGVPVSGTQSEVSFTVSPAAPAPSAAPPRGQGGGSWLSFDLVPRAEAASSAAMETTDNDVAVPIFWLVCGIIIGGIISAARTRSAGSASK
jgi:hypothetical protein